MTDKNTSTENSGKTDPEETPLNPDDFREFDEIAEALAAGDTELAGQKLEALKSWLTEQRKSPQSSTTNRAMLPLVEAVNKMRRQLDALEEANRKRAEAEAKNQTAESPSQTEPEAEPSTPPKPSPEPETPAEPEAETPPEAEAPKPPTDTPKAEDPVKSPEESPAEAPEPEAAPAPKRRFNRI